MTQRLTPGKYERRRMSDTSAQEEDLDKQLAFERLQRQYIYGTELPPEEKPADEYVPADEAPAETRIPWGLIGVIAVTGLIALSIVAIVAVKK